jgi:hypothetical protein
VHSEPAGYGPYPHYVSAYHRWITLNMGHLLSGARVAHDNTIWQSFLFGDPI